MLQDLISPAIIEEVKVRFSSQDSRFYLDEFDHSFSPCSVPESLNEGLM